MPTFTCSISWLILVFLFLFFFSVVKIKFFMLFICLHGVFNMLLDKPCANPLINTIAEYFLLKTVVCTLLVSACGCELESQTSAFRLNGLFWTQHCQVSNFNECYSIHCSCPLVKT